MDLQLPTRNSEEALRNANISEDKKGVPIVSGQLISEGLTPLRPDIPPQWPGEQHLIEALQERGYTHAEDFIEENGNSWTLFYPAHEDDDDFLLFGERYTLLWCVPNDIEYISSYLSKAYAEKCLSLHNIWNDYLPYMFYPESNDYFLLGKYLELSEALERKIRQCPNAPGEDDWEHLEDILRK